MDIHGTIYKWNKKSLLKIKVHTYTPTVSQLYLHCTFTLEALFDKTPQQTSTVVAEGGTHVVVGLKTVRHVNFKALLLELRRQTEFIISMTDPWQRNSNQWPVILHSPAHLPHFLLIFLLCLLLPSLRL